MSDEITKLLAEVMEMPVGEVKKMLEEDRAADERMMLQFAIYEGTWLGTGKPAIEFTDGSSLRVTS